MKSLKLRNPTVTIITPVFNGAKYLQETIDSIKAQGLDCIEYIIIDGGSTDGTLEIVRDNSDFISCYISEPDNGLYHALSKGFKLATGDIIGYINAGDFYVSNAIKTVVEAFVDHSVSWLTGVKTISNDNSVVTACDIPFRYKSKLIRGGYYGSVLPFIQQESTFWNKELLCQIDIEKMSTLKLAGDYFIWYELAKLNDLYVIESQIGVFKKHPGQLSESMGSYLDEIKKFCEKKTICSNILFLIEALFWSVHPRFRNIMTRNAIFYDHRLGTWSKK